MCKRHIGLFAVLAVLLLSGCLATTDQGRAPAQYPEMLTLSGTVFYRERIMLPPGSEVVVRLEDVSRMDVASELIAETRFVPEGGPPYAFALDYDAGRIKPRLRYNLRASIYSDGRLRFISDYAIDPFNPVQPLEILLKSAGGAR